MDQSTSETIISKDANFNGEIRYSKKLTIEGTFEGKINSDGELNIGKEADVKADIQVGSLVLEGKLKGNVHSKNNIRLRQTAKMFGDIKSSSMMIEEGVVFVGKSEVGKSS